MHCMYVYMYCSIYIYICTAVSIVGIKIFDLQLSLPCYGNYNDKYNKSNKKYQIKYLDTYSWYRSICSCGEELIVDVTLLKRQYWISAWKWIIVKVEMFPVSRALSCAPLRHLHSALLCYSFLCSLNLLKNYWPTLLSNLILFSRKRCSYPNKSVLNKAECTSTRKSLYLWNFQKGW